MLRITQGDGSVVFNFTAVNNLIPVNLTGATFQTTIKGPSAVNITFPNSQHTANPDQVNHTGQFTLTLAPGDTNRLALSPPNHEVVTKIVISGVTIYFHGMDILTVQPNVPVI